MAKQSKGNNKPHGHYCRVCGEHKANEKFSGKGHAAHICKACHGLPVERRNELEKINKIDRISESFFISKENLNRLKKYAGDKRYPESSEYAKQALESFYARMDEYHGRNGVDTELRAPVTIAEIPEDIKAEALERLDELIADFLDSNGYVPEKIHMSEILSALCEEVTEGLDNIYAEPEPFSPSDYYADAFPFDPEKSFDENIADFHAAMEDETDDDEDGEIPDEAKSGAMEKELVADEALIAIYNERITAMLEDFRADGIELPSYLETLIVAETDRLILRRLVRADLTALYEIMRKPEVMYAWEQGFHKSEVRRWLNRQLTRYYKDGYGYFAVILKDTGRLIGQAGIMKSEIDGKEVTEVGYIFDNTIWGHGYATEAARACVRLASEKFGIQELYCTVRPENASSVAVAERLGMTRIGEYTKIYKEKEMPHLIYSLKLDMR